MALKLRLAGQAQLWAEIVLPRGDRVFVPTSETFELGALVPLTLETPELTSVMTVTATVVGHRPATPTTPAGLVVTLNEHAVARVKAELSALTTELALRAFRTPAPRADRLLSAQVISPTRIDGCSVKSLSLTGMTLTTPTMMPPELPVVVALQLAGGAAEIPATVSWARAELSLVGLRFEALEPKLMARLKQTIDAEGHAAAEAATPSGHTIVVADDDPSILDFLARIFSTAGHRVVRAERGDTALTAIRHERPRLVFLDVLMPGLDGLEVCIAVRADASLTRTPVVLLSAMGEQRLAETAREAKANDYLTKPMKIESVRAILSKYL